MILFQDYILECMDKMEKMFKLFEQEQRQLVPIYVTATATIDTIENPKQTVQLNAAPTIVVSNDKNSSTTPTDISEVKF